MIICKATQTDLDTQEHIYRNFHSTAVIHTLNETHRLIRKHPQIHIKKHFSVALTSTQPYTIGHTSRTHKTLTRIHTCMLLQIDTLSSCLYILTMKHKPLPLTITHPRAHTGYRRMMDIPGYLRSHKHLRAHTEQQSDACIHKDKEWPHCAEKTDAGQRTSELSTQHKI